MEQHDITVMKRQICSHDNRECCHVSVRVVARRYGAKGLVEKVCPVLLSVVNKLWAPSAPGPLPTGPTSLKDCPSAGRIPSVWQWWIHCISMTASLHMSSLHRVTALIKINSRKSKAASWCKRGFTAWPSDSYLLLCTLFESIRVRD